MSSNLNLGVFGFQESFFMVLLVSVPSLAKLQISHLPDFFFPLSNLNLELIVFFFSSFCIITNPSTNNKGFVIMPKKKKTSIFIVDTFPTERFESLLKILGRIFVGRFIIFVTFKATILNGLDKFIFFHMHLLDNL